jgi:hypothetical protein
VSEFYEELSRRISYPWNFFSLPSHYSNWDMPNRTMSIICCVKSQIVPTLYSKIIPTQGQYLRHHCELKYWVSISFLVGDQKPALNPLKAKVAICSSLNDKPNLNYRSMTCIHSVVDLVQDQVGLARVHLENIILLPGWWPTLKNLEIELETTRRSCQTITLKKKIYPSCNFFHFNIKSLLTC